MSISAKVICDSKHGSTRLITLEIELHRLILSEVNTHRSVSKNAQSSRAIPVLRQLGQVVNDPAMPVWYGKNESGMVANEELDSKSIEKVKEIILRMRDYCVEGVKELQELNLHKQTASRYIEPWMWTKGVITATEGAFESMFLLRLHKDAQPEFKALAEKMKEAIDRSIPNELKFGEWHLPYVDGITVPLPEAIKISTSCCAQVSYRRLDTSLDKALALYDMLNLPEDGVYKDNPPHFSPTEHIALAFEDGEESGNFHTPDFIQYRKMLEIGIEKHFIN